MCVNALKFYIYKLYRCNVNPRIRLFQQIRQFFVLQPPEPDKGGQPGQGAEGHVGRHPEDPDPGGRPPPGGREGRARRGRGAAAEEQDQHCLHLEPVPGGCTDNK